MAFSLTRRESIVAALAAGTTGAIVLDAFLLLVPFPGTAYLGPVEFYTFAATVLAGNTAAGTTWAVPVGMLWHVVVGVMWAFGYLYVARTKPQLVRRPAISGTAFGVVVGCVTLLTMALVGKYEPLTIHAIDRDLIAYTVFFGIPLALVAARLTPALPN
jgi:hypothetical protein